MDTLSLKYWICFCITQTVLNLLLNYMHTKRIQEITDCGLNAIKDGLYLMRDTEQRLNRIEKRLNLGQIVPIKKS